MHRSAADVVRSVVERLTANARASHPPEAPVPEETLHRLLRNVPGMVFRGAADAGRTMEMVSPGCRELTGFSPNELVWGKVVSYGTLIHPEDRRSVQDELERAIVSNRPYRIEYRIRRVDGGECVVREQGQPVSRERGGVVLEGFVMDVSEGAPGNVLGPEGLFRALGERYLVGVFIIRDRRFEYVNARLAQIFGYTEGEMLALPSVFELVHPDDAEAVTDHYRRRAEGRSDGVPFEFRGVKKDGTEVTVESVGQRIVTGRTMSVAGTVIDVTERRREDRHEGEAEQLAAVGRLALEVAHDLNNVLATIKGTAQTLLAERTGDEELTNDLQQIVSAVSRGSSIGRQLMEIGASRAGGEEIVSLAQLVEGLSPALRRALGEKIELHVEIDASVPHARIDPIRGEEMLTILAAYARRSMPEGGALTIRVREGKLVPFRAGMKEGPYVVLEAADTGNGISTEQRRRVFQPSLKGDRGLTRLWRLAYDAGGCVDLDSTPGQGSVFRVTLPAARQS
jgi:PAS domain S-box-containing protein